MIVGWPFWSLDFQFSWAMLAVQAGTTTWAAGKKRWNWKRFNHLGLKDYMESQVIDHFRVRDTQRFTSSSCWYVGRFNSRHISPWWNFPMARHPKTTRFTVEELRFPSPSWQVKAGCPSGFAASSFGSPLPTECNACQERPVFRGPDGSVDGWTVGIRMD